MEQSMAIHLDKLPIKRLEAIEENGSERFPLEIGLDERRINQIRRIDFSFALERDAKKDSTEAAPAAAPLPWQALTDNLQSALQELSVVIDLISTVETNDAVTVAGMTRPKPLPSEVLSDLSVSLATKLQKLRHLGKYFKQSSKALEQQVARETRFYGALIRLQQNWKVKRQRTVSSASTREDFVMDLVDYSLSDGSVLPRSSISTVRVERDASGMLTVQLPPKSCRSLHFGFLGSGFGHVQSYHQKNGLRTYCTEEVAKEIFNAEDLNECVKKSHLVLQEIHQAIFNEQVFELVNREILHQSPGVKVIGMQEDLLQLGIGQDTSIFLRLSAYEQNDASQPISSDHKSDSGENAASLSDCYQITNVQKPKNGIRANVPSPDCYLIYLQNLLLENRFVKSKEKRHTNKVLSSSADGSGLLGHFCMSLAHRIYSNKVLAELEKLASGVSYLHLLTHPTWHSRISSWSLSIVVPQLALHSGQHPLVDQKGYKGEAGLHFYTKVVVTDERINISGEGAPNAISSYGEITMDLRTSNCYGCDVADLSSILLLQVTSQVVRWLHKEALVVGVKVVRDFLGLYFELEEGNKIGLVAHVDPDDTLGCISWWLVMDDSSMDDGRSQGNLSNFTAENRFLGYLSPEELYSLLMDLVSLCSSSGNN